MPRWGATPEAADLLDNVPEGDPAAPFAKDAARLLRTGRRRQANRVISRVSVLSVGSTSILALPSALSRTMSAMSKMALRAGPACRSFGMLPGLRSGRPSGSRPISARAAWPTIGARAAGPNSAVPLPATISTAIDAATLRRFSLIGQSLALCRSCRAV